ncbi:malonyl coa-acyl carrier protein transacylase [hydrocarbon metagenome]|uniref:[acyl-carrier-protein] S-malonyltransferase n=1 Tax=hydrocarbon metagenome TaxID=938273 RepID=A0A0W8E5K8_9ZZZZ
MPGIAFIFPGQGAQHLGMGKDLYDNYQEAARVFDTADALAGYKLSEICFEGPLDILNQTVYAQPALLVAGLAAYEVVKSRGATPVMMAGLSLGEYTALVAAGAITFEDALPLVQNRARLMQEAVPLGEGAMAAIFGLDKEQILAACDKETGIVDIGNYNCPGQVVITGAKDAVDNVCAVLKEAGAKVIPLAVSVPAHSRLLYDAAVKLQPRLEAIDWQEPRVGVVSNVNARENPAHELEELLMKQIYYPVLWEQSVRYMMEKVDYFIEVGPGSTLSGLIRKIDKNRVLGQVNDVKTLEKTLEKVKSL